MTDAKQPSADQPTPSTGFWGRRTPTEQGCLIVGALIALSLLGQGKRALESWSAREQARSQAEDQYQEGLKALKAEDYEKAHEILSAVAPKLDDPESNQALQQASDGLATRHAKEAERLRAAGDWKKAVGVLDKARALKPSKAARQEVNAVAARIAPLAYAEGMKAFAAEDWDIALPFLKAAGTHKDAKAKKEEAAYRLGTLWMREGDWKAAKEALTEAGGHRDAREQLARAEANLKAQAKQRHDARRSAERIKKLYAEGEPLLIGDVGYLVSKGGEAIPAATSEANYDRMSRAVVANDDLGLQQLRRASLVVVVPAGTRVRGIGSGGTLGSLTQARIEDGPLKGHSVWVAAEFARK